MTASAFWCPTCRTMRMDAVGLRDRRDYAPAPAAGGQPPDLRECHRCSVARERALWEAFEEFPGRRLREDRPGHGPGATSVDGADERASDVDGLRLRLTEAPGDCYRVQVSDHGSTVGLRRRG